jgi:AbrB family looped-hinge helix DNA binding protein
MKEVLSDFKAHPNPMDDGELDAYVAYLPVKKWLEDLGVILLGTRLPDPFLFRTSRDSRERSWSIPRHSQLEPDLNITTISEPRVIAAFSFQPIGKPVLEGVPGAVLSAKSLLSDVILRLDRIHHPNVAGAPLRTLAEEWTWIDRAGPKEFLSRRVRATGSRLLETEALREDCRENKCSHARFIWRTAGPTIRRLTYCYHNPAVWLLTARLRRSEARSMEPGNLAEWVAALAGVVAAAATIGTLLFLVWQMTDLKRRVQGQTYQAVYSQMLDLDRFFFDHPQFRKSFYDGESPPERDREQMVFVVAKVTLDKAGRVVLPKIVRDELRLSPGDTLELTMEGEQMTLRPQRATSPLQKERGVRVFRSGQKLTAAETRETLRNVRHLWR